MSKMRSGFAFAAGLVQIGARAKALGLALCALVAVTLAAPAQDVGAVGPALGGASNMSQGQQPAMLDHAARLGVTDFRDGMAWARAEPEPGRYDFSSRRVGYPVRVGALGGHVSVVLNWGNQLYDGGDTPHSPEALRAFGAFAAALVNRFPQIDSLEIGNEFNGVNFVKGPIREMAPLDRARAYVPMLEAASRAARAARPEIRISGGATHSLPAGYLWALLDAGAANWLDSLAVHPYTTPAEQFVRQVDVLRRHPAAAGVPLEVTEFGHPDPTRAAGHFLRNYCQFALGGVTRAIWFPLNMRGGKMVPLFTPDGAVTPAGEAFRLAAGHMEGRPVQNAAVDPFSYGCQFGGDVMVVWGAARPVEVAPGVTVFDAQGRPVAPPLQLDPDAPLVLLAPPGGAIADLVSIDASGIVADSFDQFAYPVADEALAAGDGFERFARRDGEEIALGTLPGQQSPGSPWVPYRGNEAFGPIRLTAESLLPGRRGGSAVEIVHRYIVTDAGMVTLSARIQPAQRSVDGVSVRITQNGEVLFEDAGKDEMVAELADIAVTAGDQLEIAVGPNGTAQGDVTNYRITLKRP